MELRWELDSPLISPENNISPPFLCARNPDDSVTCNNKLYEVFMNQEREEPSNNFDYSNFNSIYFLDENPKKKESEKISQVTTKITDNNKKIFEIAKVEKEKEKEDEKEKEKEKKFGRKRKGDHQDDEKTHTKYDKDNIHRKIQVDFINFLFAFINEILIYFGIKQKFLGIDYKNKKVVTKDYVENLKTTEIGQILCKDISPKYQTLYNKNKDFNCKLYLKVIKNESIKNILSEKYINIFRNLYYKNKRDLNDYGLNIKLSNKVETYQDLLDRNNDDNEYIEGIKNLVKYCYLPQKFVTQK
jgi:hypothetical protein